MAREGKLQPATEGGALDRCDDRLGCRLHLHLYLARDRRFQSDPGSDLVEVRAGGKAAPGPGDDDGFDGGIGRRSLQPIPQPLAHCVAQCVDRWIVDLENHNITVGAVVHGRHDLLLRI